MADLTLTGAHTTTVVGADDATKEINKGQWNGTGAHSIIASMATAKLLGRNTASTGSPEEITLGTNLSFTGTTLNASSASAGWTRVTKTNADTPYTIPEADVLVASDTSGGVLTVNLPASPADADIVAVKRITTDATALTIGRNGKKIEGVAANITAISGVLACYEFQYDSNSGSWWII